MNTNENQRFYELAHRTLGREAGPEEQAELLALIAENPGLKEEFEHLGAETNVAREMLMLMEDVQHPHPTASRIPMTKLRARVAQGRAREPAEPDLNELLVRLRKWAATRLGTNRERQLDLHAAFSEFPQAEEEPMAQMLFSSSMASLHETGPASREALVRRAVAELRELVLAREAEVESQLHSLQARIRHAEQTAQECRIEVEALIAALNRERREVEELLRNS